MSNRRDPQADYRRATETVTSVDATPDGVLDALAGLANVRQDLDRLERDLIGSARDHGATWPEIATALGLGTRQAAEQRWLRLSGDATRDPTQVRHGRVRQRTVDTRNGPELAELRRAAVEMARRVAADWGWDDRHSRAALARTSLEAAVGAEPGALYALCRNALDDFDAMRPVRLPPVLAGAVRRFGLAVAAASRASIQASKASIQG